MVRNPNPSRNKKLRQLAVVPLSAVDLCACAERSCFFLFLRTDPGLKCLCHETDVNGESSYFLCKAKIGALCLIFTGSNLTF